MENIKLEEVSINELLNEVACVLDFVNSSLEAIIDNEKQAATNFGLFLVLNELIKKINFIASEIPNDQKILMPDGVFTNQI